MKTEFSVLSLQTARGGWKRADLEKWGIKWPPKHGWKKTLLENERRKDKARLRNNALKQAKEKI